MKPRERWIVEYCWPASVKIPQWPLSLDAAEWKAISEGAFSHLRSSKDMTPRRLSTCVRGLDRLREVYPGFYDYRLRNVDTNEIIPGEAIQ